MLEYCEKEAIARRTSRKSSRTSRLLGDNRGCEECFCPSYAKFNRLYVVFLSRRAKPASNDCKVHRPSRFAQVKSNRHELPYWKTFPIWQACLHTTRVCSFRLPHFDCWCLCRASAQRACLVSPRHDLLLHFNDFVASTPQDNHHTYALPPAPLLKPFLHVLPAQVHAARRSRAH